jgi:hypothetical protein
MSSGCAGAVPAIHARGGRMIFINILLDYEDFRIKPRLSHWGDEIVFDWLFFQIGIDLYK